MLLNPHRWTAGHWAAIGSLLFALLTGCSDGGGNGDACLAGLVGGELVITEIMANPDGNDEGQEWFELYNASSASVDLTGVVLAAGRADGTNDMIHVIAGAEIGPGTYLVVGGVLHDIRPAHVDYGYGGDLGGLLNAGGKLSVRCGGKTIDEAVYDEMQDGYARGFDGSRVPDTIGNDNLDDWCDAEQEYETGAFGTPGAVNDECEGELPDGQCKEGEQIRDAVAPTAGDLVVTEFMPNPEAVGDAEGEWFEVYVGRDVDINGLELGKTPGTVEVEVKSVDCLRASAGSYLVFARSTDTGVNGGLPAVDAVFDFGLTNSGGSLFVGHGGLALDEVSWGSSSSGAATSLDPTLVDPAENDNPDNWCRAEDAYGQGDRGTPGAANPSCGIVPEGQCLEGDQLRDKVPAAAGDLVITEIMGNPDAVGDTQGEWFELLVLADLDLNGLELGRDPLDPDMTLPEGDCLRITAGTYVLFARSTDAGVNGGLPPVDFAISFSLVNSGGHLFVGLPGEVLDEVPYGSVPTGAAKSLDAAHLNPTANDDEANWCPAQAAYGAGDLGTPAAENPACP